MKTLIHLLLQPAPYGMLAVLGFATSLSSHITNHFIGWTDRAVFRVNPLIEVLPWLGLAMGLSMIVMLIVTYEAPRD